MTTDNDILLSLEDVAAKTLAPISTVRWWVQTGKLQSLKVGRRRRVKAGELDRFLRECEGK